MMNTSYLTLQSRREIEGPSFSGQFQRIRHATSDVISRLGLETELTGHTGCVNCLEWSRDGSVLASGSDDCHVILWAPLQHAKLTSFRTLHSGNVFSVKFMPQSRNRIVATGAADSKITLVDLEAENTLHVFTNHKSRVKRLAVAEDEPHLLFSASEDGTVMQFDLRTPEEYANNKARSVLVNLTHYMGIQAEAKCLSICPTRTELLAVGCGDPYVRLYDRRMIKCSEAPRSLVDGSSDVQYELPSNCVRYFVPGHVPDKVADYSRRYKMLAATYTTFSPDGRDLLVNLGGEQIYLYSVNDATKSYKLELHNSSNGYRDKPGYNSQTNGYHHQDLNYTPFILCNINELEGEDCASPLPTNIELLKREANQNYETQNYALSIELYNKAIHLHSESSVLYSNRAAALLKRNWSGDTYAAVSDCIRSIQLNRRQHKAYYRLCTSLIALGREEEATICFNYFQRLFPDRTNSRSFKRLQSNLHDMDEISKACPSRRRMDEGVDEEVDEGDACSSVASSRQEKVWQRQANDYNQRFCGHCNTTTDIKEANFIGDNGQYIAAGSDDGSFFIWDRKTTNIMRTLRGDDCIVNCVQPHPETCLLATSGIDPVVRLWSPLPEGTKHDRCIDNSHDAANRNQRRMNADPLEVMLMNMGQTIRRSTDTENDDASDMQCRPF